MTAEVYTDGGVTVVRPKGDIRVKSFMPLRETFERLEEEDAAKIAVDLSNVEFIDSSGLGLLVNFAKRVAKRSGAFCLFNYRDDVKDLLDITGIDQAIPLFDTPDGMRTGMADDE